VEDHRLALAHGQAPQRPPHVDVGQLVRPAVDVVGPGSELRLAGQASPTTAAQVEGDGGGPCGRVARVGADAGPITPRPAQRLLGGIRSRFPVERGEKAQPGQPGCGLLEELGKLHLLV
jgi:hypothetical protein